MRGVVVSNTSSRPIKKLKTGFEIDSLSEVYDGYGGIKYEAVRKVLMHKFGVDWKDPKYIWKSEKTTIDMQGLFICAPPSNFDTKGLSKKGLLGWFETKTEILKDDPIVYRYVRGGVQVLSKWGLEANDGALVNERMN